MPINTILFDLDDTLLGNNMDEFIQPYLQSFAGYMAGLVDPNAFIGGLLAGTQAMLANDDPRRTLQETFYESFYQGLSTSPEALGPRIESFYREQFPALRKVTRPVPAAPAAVRWAFEQGSKVVIATNALFPRSAIEQRLDWAGVDIGQFPYALVTTLEFMHFAKPHPEYFAEILSLVDSRPEEALMIGNDWSQDIAPAAAAGVHTYWINSGGAPPAGDTLRPAGQGSLADFLQWAQTGALKDLAPLPHSPAGIRAQQAASLAALFHRTHGLDDGVWTHRPRVADWSLTEIACHLRDTEIEINLPRLQYILDEPNAFISAIESDPWAVERDYQAQSGPEALNAFAQARRAKLALLDRLTFEEWARPARHTIFGPTTLQEIVAFTGEHDRLHLRQMEENLESAL